MSVESIFQQLHDPTTWPAPPERPLRPYSADFRPGVLASMPVETLRRWTAVAKRRDRPCGSSLTERHGAGPNVCTIWSGFMMWMIANEMILIMLLGVPNED